MLGAKCLRTTALVLNSSCNVRHLEKKIVQMDGFTYICDSCGMFVLVGKKRKRKEKSYMKLTL